MINITAPFIKLQVNISARYTQLSSRLTNSYAYKYLSVQWRLLTKWFARLNPRDALILKIVALVLILAGMYMLFIFPPLASYQSADAQHNKLRKNVTWMEQNIHQFKQLNSSAEASIDVIRSIDTLEKRIKITIKSFVIKRAKFRRLTDNKKKYLRVTWYKENVQEVFKVLDKIYAMGVNINKLNYVSLRRNRADIDVFLEL
jgi:type II secretory pathway component PulM